MKETKTIHLAPIPPRALASGNVEAISGFALTLARRHSLLTGTLLRNAVAVPEFGIQKSSHFRMRHALRSVDGYGRYAIFMTERLELLTRNGDLSGTTLLKLRDVLNPMGHALIHQHRHWCDTCFLEDIAESDGPYQRLVWCVRSSTHCAIHRCQLSNQCPACLAYQPYFPALPFLGHCDKCGQRLFFAAGPIAADDNIDLIKSIYVFELIEAMQILTEPLEHQKFVQWLNALCDQYRDGSPDKSISSVSSIDSSNFRRWLSGETKPSLDVLLHFCATLQCSPAAMITGQPSLIDFQAIGFVKRAKMSKRIRRSGAENETIEAHLKLALDRHLSSAPSLKTVAKELNCQVSYLIHRFPKMACQIRDRALSSRNSAASLRLDSFKVQLMETLVELDRHAVYPSVRNIRWVSGMSASVLAKPELRLILAEKRNESLKALLHG